MGPLLLVEPLKLWGLRTWFEGFAGAILCDSAALARANGRDLRNADWRRMLVNEHFFLDHMFNSHLTVMPPCLLNHVFRGISPKDNAAVMLLWLNWDSSSCMCSASLAERTKQ